MFSCVACCCSDDARKLRWFDCVMSATQVVVETYVLSWARLTFSRQDFDADVLLRELYVRLQSQLSVSALGEMFVTVHVFVLVYFVFVFLLCLCVCVCV